MKGIAHALYWRLHTSFLKNDRKRAIATLGMLEDEMKRSSLQDEIGEIHFERFERIRSLMAHGEFGRLYGVGFDLPPAEACLNAENETSEKEFHGALMTKEGREKLLSCLGIQPNAMIGHELDMMPYGRCDVVIREGRTIHAVELKKEAKSSVVSQIDKYRLGLELEMANGLHDRVNAVVIAESFSPYVAGELSRLSVQMVKHDGTPESLRRI